MKDVDFLKIQEHALEVRESYKQQDTKSKINILNLGKPGTGKTRLAVTCPKPVHIDCFDRGGTRTAELQPFIASGAIIVDNSFENDSWKEPRAFRLWEKKLKIRRDLGYFDYIGTYMLDSLTTFANSMMYAILMKGGDKRGSRTGQLPEQQDYHLQQYTLVDYLDVLMQLPCNVIANGHVVLIEDNVSGRLETGILLAGKASDKVPPAFDEKYISRCISEDKYVLQTRSDGKWHAETRIGGGGIFEHHEEQNLYKLLKKAGYPAEDKPLLSELAAKAKQTITQGETK